MIVSIPTTTEDYCAFIEGAARFYRGRRRPSKSQIEARKNGWDFAARMQKLGINSERRHATVH